ncbi:unnamed protein product [Pipistrellus nathusii]|uniref:Uncharacterized protein n=1 Tax=Pipistrellus nathusii TaxID=59473 RepID=A0ABN9ZE41_PIPNA
MQLRSGGYKGPVRWLPSSPFQMAVSSQDNPFLPHSSPSWTQILSFPHVHIHNENSALWAGPWYGFEIRKSGTALREVTESCEFLDGPELGSPGRSQGLPSPLPLGM